MGKIIQGDCLEAMKTLEPDSVDAVITDPPYGYSFMGKDWDKAVPSVDTWKECLRVLKPGAFACVMSAPRSDVQMHMIQNLTEAGFRLDFTPIYWTYASGFPKAGNIGKMVDKRNGTTPDQSKESGYKLDYDVTVPATNQAKALDGSYAGFQPKPAVEVIIIAMKPLSEKTFVDQALKNGKGISWLDDVRIPTGEQAMLDAAVKRMAGNKANSGAFQSSQSIQPNSAQGRFPANLLVSDDVLNDGVVHKSPAPYHQTTDSEMWSMPTIKGKSTHKGDSGSYSRYFDLDKWASTLPFLIVPKASKGEKNKGLDEFEPTKTNDGRNKEIDNAFQRGSTLRNNHHPTVKPLKLMSYLITLFSREGDTVLDPFLGSGTTALAARKLSRKYIGIELNQEYVDLAQARLDDKQEALF